MSKLGREKNQHFGFYTQTYKVLQLSYILTIRCTCQIRYVFAYDAEIHSPCENEKLLVPESLFYFRLKNLRWN